MLKREHTPNEKTTILATLLDDMVAEGSISGRSLEMRITTAAVPSGEAVSIKMVEFQLVSWHYVEVPCPGCGHYPCQPGQMNGHRLHIVAKPGPVVQVAV